MKVNTNASKRGPGRKRKRTAALALAVGAALAASSVPVRAAGIGDSVAPACDEAYYAMLDYYGNLTDGSVVKSYAMNGVAKLTDYGTYSQVTNLTDDVAPVTSGGKTTFTFPDGSVPDHFYFEGTTKEPFRNLPWKLTLSYTLNGVPTRAEDLAGKTGVVEIKVDAVPNENAGDYARNNETLEAMAAFNEDDILSLEAPGAQVQLIGNLRVVLFLAMPGEEQHFVIRVGSSDFSFDGMTFLIVPATLSQLDDIADLQDKKKDLEDNYDKLSSSLDTLLDSLDGMSGSLNATASGLDQLDQARGTVSAGKGQVYGDLDLSLADLAELSKDLEPAQQHLDAASSALTEISTDANALHAKAMTLKTDISNTKLDLGDLKDDLSDLRAGSGSLDNVRGDLTILGNRLNTLRGTLQSMSGALDTMRSQLNSLSGGSEVTVNGQTVGDIRAAESTVTALHEQYVAYMEGTYGLTEDQVTDDNFETFMTSAIAQSLAGDGNTPTEEQLAAAAAKAAALYQLWETMQADPSGLDSQLAEADNVNSLLRSCNMTVDQMKTLLNTFGPSTQNLLSQLSSLCDALGESGLSGSLSGLLNNANNTLANVSDLSGDLSSALTKTGDSLDLLDQLNKTVNGYIPEAQQALTDSKTLAASSAAGLAHCNTLLTDLEALTKKSGAQLDSGSKQTLEGLAGTLRKSAGSLSDTEDVRSAKDNINGIIEDEWDKYNGDESNLLNMDAKASAVSMTSAENPAPSSIQVLIRSEEIKVPEDKTPETEQKTAGQGTFWSRVGKMFRDFWHTVTGIF
jgi:putative membrane protein